MAFENKKQGKPASEDDKLLQFVAPHLPRGPGLH